MMRNIFVLLLLLCFHAPPVSAADRTATLKAETNKSSLVQDETVTASILLSTGGQAAIFAAVKVSFSSNLTYQSFSADGSVFGVEIDQPTVDGPTVSFSRTDFNTSYSGSNGLVAKLTFKATGTGSADISIQQDASQVKADSDLSNILQSVQNATFTVATAPTPTPVASPEPTPTPEPTTAPATTATATPAPSATATPKSNTPTPKASAKSTVKNTPTPSASVAATPTEAPSPSPTPEPTSSAIAATPAPDLISPPTPITTPFAAGALLSAISIIGIVASILKLRGPK